MTATDGVMNGLCYMCTACCPTKIHVSGGKITDIEIADERVVACPRWRAQLDFIYHPDRLKHPLKRTGSRGSGAYERISWDEALDTAAANLQKVKDSYGPESVVFWVAYTKEPRPYFHRLTHAFGSPNYCTESSNCFSATLLASNLIYGPDFSSPALDGRSVNPDNKCELIWGNTVQNSNPGNWQAHLEAREKGCKLIVVDPRRTVIASMADIYLQLRPGTDGALALGMMNVIIEKDLYDREFVEKWTVGFDDLKKLVKEYAPERVEEITGVPAGKTREAAIMYATCKPAQLTPSGNSSTHHTNGVQNHRAIILLPAITGNISPVVDNGAPGPGPMINDITLHERVEKMPPGIGSGRFPIWTKRYREMQSNAIADQIDSGEPYPIKALYSAGLDIQFFANSNRMAESLKKLDFIAVNEYFPTPGAQFADIVMPIASWVERPILTTAYSPVIKLIEPAIEPPGECRTEWDIFCELAERLGIGDLFWHGNFEKCANHIIEPLGIDLDYLRQHLEGVPNPEPGGGDRHGFSTPSGKVEITSDILAEHGLEPLPIYREPPESPLSQPDLAKSYPLVLTSGARVPAYTHSQGRNIERLRRLMPDPLVEINPSDAAPRGIQSGDTVTITSLRGSIKMKAKVTDTMIAGAVSIPHHWPGEANANTLVDDVELDPISGFIPCKSMLCQITKG